MLSSRCPKCGSPCPVSLAQPSELRCRSCGFAGAPDPRIVEELRGAWVALGGLDVRRRQLGDLHRREIAQASTYMGIFIGVWVLGILGALGWSLIGVLLMLDTSGPKVGPGTYVFVGITFFSPLVLLGGSGLFVRSRMARRVDRLKDAAAAAPPAAPGEPARCYMCGAEASAGRDAVVRCAFCGTDNVVDDAVVARVARRNVDATDGLARRILAQAPANADAGFSALTFLVTFTAGMPIIAIVLALVFFVVASSIHRDADMDRRYVVVERNGHRCVGTVQGETDKVRVEMGGNRPSGFEYTEFLDVKDTKPIKLEELRGKRVTVGTSTKGTVVGFTQTFLDDNELVLDGGETPLVSGACFVDP